MKICFYDLKNFLRSVGSKIPLRKRMVEGVTSTISSGIMYGIICVYEHLGLIYIHEMDMCVCVCVLICTHILLNACIHTYTADVRALILC